MQVADIATRNVDTIPPDAPIEEAARHMRMRDVGALPVCDGERLLGMITDRDIAIRAVANGWEPGRAVRDVMSPEVAFVFADEDLRRAAEIMEQKQIRRLPVLDRGRRLVGILSQADIALTGDDQLSGEIVERISEPTPGARRMQ